MSLIINMFLIVDASEPFEAKFIYSGFFFDLHLFSVLLKNFLAKFSFADVGKFISDFRIASHTSYVFSDVLISCIQCSYCTVA